MGLSHLAMLTLVTMCGPESPQTKTFRSTGSGLSLEYPSSWVTEPPLVCGNESREFTKRQREHQLRPLVILYSEKQAGFGELRPAIYVMYQAIRSEAERKSDDEYLVGHLPIGCQSFSTTQGTAGCKFVEEARPGGPIPVSIIRYWIPHHGRLYCLMCLDGGRGLAGWESVFDEVANSVKMTDPFTVISNVVQKNCATFAYPADWTKTVWSHDDDHEGFRFEAPHPGTKETATVQLLFEDKSITQYEEESRASLLQNSRWFEITKFENSKGQTGLKLAAEMGIGKTHKTTWFALPCSDGKLAVLFCWDHDNDDEEWEPAFDEVGLSFVVQ